jgi:hypothetical protein
MDHYIITKYMADEYVRGVLRRRLDTLESMRGRVLALKKQAEDLEQRILRLQGAPHASPRAEDDGPKEVDG